MKELGVKDEHALQSYFIQRIGKFLDANGRKLIGWDEILEGGLAPNATVMSWRGIDGAIAAAKAGHDTVLSPAPDLYFDHWQSPGDISPGRSNTLSLKDVYRFDPVPGIDPARAAQAHPRPAGQPLDRDDAHRGARDLHGLSRASRRSPKSPGRRRSASTGKISRSACEPQLARYATLGIGYARERRCVPRTAPAREPRARAVRRRLSAVARGRCAARRASARCSSWTSPIPAGSGAARTCRRSKAIRASVGQIPFNFQIGKDAQKIPLRKPATPTASSKCVSTTATGKLIASASLAPAVANTGSRRCRPSICRRQRGAARPLLHVHASQGRSDLGHRQSRARRILTMPLIILAPFAGWCAPLEEIPDAVFAQGMLGDGVAIDPTGNELHAPCDGEVISVAAARHALALRAAGRRGNSVHVGIDTVALSGEGFEVHVRRATACTPATCCSPSISTAGAQGAEPHHAGHRHQRRALPDRAARTSIGAGRQWRCAVRARGVRGRRAGDAASPRRGAVWSANRVVVAHAHGIHARPAALIARIAKEPALRDRDCARADAAPARAAPWR